MTGNRTQYVLPAEWAPQSGMQLTWPHQGTDWKPYLPEITHTFLLLAQEISRQEKLIIAAQYPEETEKLLAGHLPQENMKNIRVYRCANNDTWARDHGLLTLMPMGGATDGENRPLLLNFRFNGWGKKFKWEKDNAISQRLFEQHAFQGEIEEHDDFVLEGGSVESDGQGTLMTTSFCLLAPHRNQPLSQQDIERRLCAYFNARRVIWLHHGRLMGDDTDGHIDTIVRFCPDNTMVYQGCDDPQDEQFEDLRLMEEELQALRTPQGNSYRLLKLPMPDAMYEDGNRLPATYANFVLLNRSVVVPTYGNAKKDAGAAHILQQAFPGKEVVGIDATTVVRQHGSLHCLTMQYPAGVIQ